MSAFRNLRLFVAAAITLVIAIVFAGHTAMAAVCNGQDLLGKLEDENPALYRQVASEAAKSPNGEAMLWKIEGNGAAEPSYLLGTIHMTDERVAKLSEPVREIFKTVKKVALEIANIGDKQAMQAELGKRPDLMVLKGGSLWDYVKPEMKDIIAGQLEQVGIPQAVAGRLQPWLPAMTLAVSLCEAQRNQAGHLVLDQALEAYAKAQGAQVIGLESAIEQFAIMSSMPLESQAIFLIDAARMRDQVNDLNETMIQAYLDRKVTWFIPLSKAIAKKKQTDDQKAAEADFLSALIDRRNANMAVRAEAMLKTGNALIAVGALHLPGDKGLVALFRKQGFTVTAVN
ncbi:MAG: TraB/GumN family protein [Rhizobiales bacterium]|nr:TraB/GumN family protein [Hyphomicrobiales bacterium]